MSIGARQSWWIHAEEHPGPRRPDPGLPTGWRPELVRDLINFAYRSYIAETAGRGVLR